MPKLAFFFWKKGILMEMQMETIDLTTKQSNDNNKLIITISLNWHILDDDDDDEITTRKWMIDVLDMRRTCTRRNDL